MLNMKKKAETFLTQKGYDTFKRLRETEGEELPTLYGLLGTFRDDPYFTLQEFVDELKMSGQPLEAIEDVIETWRVAHEQGLLSTEENLPIEGEKFDLPSNLPEGIASKLTMKKKAKYVYTAELLSAMTQGLERLSANYTVDGAEAVVNFQSEGEAEPQQYHIRITAMSEVERRQEAAGGEPGYSWGPEGPPPGITNASKLNMKKISLEIGGETFPDSLKFKDPSSEFSVKRTIGALYQEAETFVVDYIWKGLQAHGITGPDNANVIQTDVDKVQFSSASSLVQQLMEEGWFKYLERTSDESLKVDPELQQQVFNTIRDAIKEGTV